MSPVRACALQLSLDLQLRTLQLSTLVANGVIVQDDTRITYYSFVVRIGRSRRP